jgi:putative PIN family toxin of toxin-antitoxin system
MKIVLDTNQWVSALICPQGRPAQIVQAWRHGKVEIALSPGILNELFNVLRRPRIKNKYHLTDTDIADFLQLLKQYTCIVQGESNINITKDPDDNIIIACAVAAGADYIISGDHHLVEILEYQGIRIIHAATFLQML